MTDLPAPTIERAYRVRLRPTPAQVRMLNRLFGAKRFVWNWALSTKESAFRIDGTRLGTKALSAELTQLRKTGDTAWLSQLPREPMKNVLRDLDKAYRNFFAGWAKHPRRKKFGSVSSVRFTLDQRRQQVNRDTGRVQLDGIGKVRFRITEPLVGRLRSVTVSKDAAGRFHASFTADGIPKPDAAPAKAASLGIDLGLKATATLSNGEVVQAKKALTEKLKRLRRYQRHYARQRDAAARRQGLDPRKPFPKGTRIEVSRRMQRTKQRIGKLHASIADTRRNHLHQVSAAAIAHAEVICLETLNLKAMQRGMGRKAFRRSVSDAGLGELNRQLEYKAKWYGRVISRVDRFYPSSKTCHACGYHHAELKLSERQWTCPNCQSHHDRDHNAARNIEAEGLRLLSTLGSRGIDAQGEATCAGGRTSPSGQPTSENCELTYRTAKPCPTVNRRLERRGKVAG